jgi:hypothetical protein
MAYALLLGLMMDSAMEAARRAPVRLFLMSAFILFWPVACFVKAFRAYVQHRLDEVP